MSHSRGLEVHSLLVSSSDFPHSVFDARQASRFLAILIQAISTHAELAARVLRIAMCKISSSFIRLYMVIQETKVPVFPPTAIRSNGSKILLVDGGKFPWPIQLG